MTRPEPTGQPGTPESSGHPGTPGSSGPPGTPPTAASARVAARGRVPAPAGPRAQPAPAGTVPADDPTTGAVITTSAAAAAAAAALPPAAPATTAPPAPPPGPPAGDPEQPAGSPGPAQPWQPRRHRPLSRLRIGQHAAPPAALDQLQLAIGSVGLRLGRGQAGEPVTVRLFRPEPIRVGLVGQAWLADLVAFRALRFGARVVVFTHHPAGWIDLGQRASGRTDRVAVLVPGSQVSMAASADTPTLQLAGAAVPAGDDLPSWTTWLSVLPPATVTDLAIRPDRAAQLAGAELVLTQRLAPAQAAALASVRRLARPEYESLLTLPDGVVAVLAGTGIRSAQVDLTSVEREVLAQPAQL